MTVAVMPDRTPKGDGSGAGERRQASAKPATEYKVFVGGISWHMDDKELKQSKKRLCQCPSLRSSFTFGVPLHRLIRYKDVNLRSRETNTC